MNAYIGWHIELTRKCGLRCPACPRTYETRTPEDLKTDISTNNLLNFFPTKAISKFKYIYFQGNLGDPIYHPDFHLISEHFFPAHHIAVTTNGIQSKDFWHRVLTTWPPHSRISFSIDGLMDTNSMYRVGSKWQLIQELFQVIRSTKRKCELEWKYIVFEHNKHQIDEARDLARSVGFDIFRIQKSRTLTQEMNLNGALQTYWDGAWDHEQAIYSPNELDPFCMTGDMHYINAHGDYFPCCWLPSADSSKKNKPIDTLNISDSNISDFHRYFKKFQKQLEVFADSPATCQFFCRKKINSGRDHKVPITQQHRQFTRFLSTHMEKSNIFEAKNKK